MFTDPLGDCSPNDKIIYASILVLIASADGELVREEFCAIEALMGRILIHPEVRVDIRNLLTDPPDMDELLIAIDPSLIKFALRDAALVAAIDGEYDETELELINQLASAAEVDDETLKEIFDWVNSGLIWHNQSLAILEL
ncbi:MAG: hypothetical protein NZ736_03025 [Candidatus Poseidoniaceae archaeon]|nr:hypothetical protein [Candidatus Poseidoniaceae archaeon]